LASPKLLHKSRLLERNIPSAPVLKREPPKGPQWIHEVKFEGWCGPLLKPAMT